jgi:hypothetical protein
VLPLTHFIFPTVLYNQLALFQCDPPPCTTAYRREILRRSPRSRRHQISVLTRVSYFWHPLSLDGHRRSTSAIFRGVFHLFWIFSATFLILPHLYRHVCIWFRRCFVFQSQFHYPSFDSLRKIGRCCQLCRLSCCR